MSSNRRGFSSLGVNVTGQLDLYWKTTLSASGHLVITQVSSVCTKGNTQEQ